VRTPALRFVAFWAAVATITGSCGPGVKQTPNTGSGSGSSSLALDQTAKDLPPGLDLRLSQGQQGPDAIDHSKLAPATKISDADAEALLNRLKPIDAKPTDTTDFALRPSSTPPPRTGKTIKGTFPAAGGSAPPATSNDTNKELTVLRWAPEGDVPIAPQLQVTFSQPMVAVTSQTDAATVQPVQLDPTPAGRWRWIGTKTILFDPDVRFPMATTYKVTIPSGTKSATGNSLKEAKSFTFTTPAPTMVNYWPSGGPTKLDVPMFVLFDQKIDAATVLGKITVTAGKQTAQLRMLDDAEIAKDADVKSLVDAAKTAGQDGRWVAFKASEDFPKDTDVVVTIAKGTPSALTLIVASTAARSIF